MVEFDRSLAVVIGINNYQNGIDTLQTAVPDALEIAEILQNTYNYELIHPDFNSGVVVNQYATKDKLQKLLTDILPKKIKPTKSERLIFYFAGHGIARNSDDEPQGFLVPQDADMKRQDSLLRMSDVHDWLAKLECKHLLVILDCCFAGAFRWASYRKLIPIGQEITKAHYDRFIRFPAWQVLTSASDSELALEFVNNRDRDNKRKKANNAQTHSPFASGLIEALENNKADLNDDGVIIATELYLFLQEYVAKNANEKQTPNFFPLRKHDRGEYLFKLPNFEWDKLRDAPDLKDPKNNPYRGLEPFEEEHAPLFFGRDEVVESLLTKVVNLVQPNNQLTVVTGISGSGKSSLVKAGLIPKLDNNTEQEWHIIAETRKDDDGKECRKIMRPSSHPYASLTRAIADLNEEKIIKTGDITIIGKQLKNNSSRFIDIIQDWSQRHPSSRLLLVIDQFEELITMSPQKVKQASNSRKKSRKEKPQERLGFAKQEPELDKVEEETEKWTEFVSLLTEILDKCPQLSLVITLRSDFEPRFQNSAFGRDWAKARFTVRPMRSDELREVVEKPAAEKALYFEPPELVDRLADEVSQMPGALPLLSFTLSEMYLKLHKAWIKEGKENRALTIAEDFDREGGVAGALTRRANAEYENLPDDEHRQTMSKVMLRMVEVEGGEAVRQRVPKSDLKYSQAEENQRVKVVLQSLDRARLIVGGEEAGIAYVEPAHDFLVRGWDKLQSWIQKEQENLSLQKRLTPDAKDWKINKDDAYLWSVDPRLPLLEEILKMPRSKNWLNQLEEEFVNLSIRKREDELKKTKERLRISQENLSNSYVNNSKTKLENHNHNHAVLIAAEALKSSENLEARKILLENPVYGLCEVLPGHQREVSSLDFSPDSRLLASSGRDGKIRIWDIVSGTEKVSLKVVNYEQKDDSSSDIFPDIKHVKFSPDGNLLAVSCLDGTISLWEMPSLTKRFELKDWYDFSGSMDFIPINFTDNSSSLVVALDDNTIRFLNVDSGKEDLSKRISLENRVEDFVLASTLSLLICISYEEIILWDTRKNQRIKSWKPPMAEEFMGPNMFNVAFDPNQELIATGTHSNLIWVWNTKGELVRTLTLFPITKSPLDSINKIAFGTDGLTIIASKPNGSLVIWELRDGSLLQVIPASEHDISALALSPDCTIAATGEGFTTENEPRLIHLWDLNFSYQRAIFLHKNPYNQERLVVKTIDVHPSNKQIASGTDFGEIHIWDIENQQLFEKIKAAVGDSGTPVNWLGYSQDGNFLVGISGYRAKFWNARTYELITEYDLTQVLDWPRFSLTWGAVNINQNLLITTSYNAFQLWKIEHNHLSEDKNPLLLNCESDSDSISYEKISFSPDGNHLVIKVPSSDSDRLLIKNISDLINNTDSKNHQYFVNPDDERIKDFAFSPQGFIATCHNSICIWSYPEFQKLCEIEQSAYHLAFSPDGKWLASADLYNVSLWRVSDHKEIAFFPTQNPILINELVSHQIEALTFSKDSKRLFSAGYDGTVQMWNLENLLLDAETVTTRNQLLTGWQVQGGNIVPLSDWHEQAKDNAFFQSFRHSVFQRIQCFSKECNKARKD